MDPWGLFVRVMARECNGSDVGLIRARSGDSAAELSAEDELSL